MARVQLFAVDEGRATAAIDTDAEDNITQIVLVNDGAGTLTLKITDAAGEQSEEFTATAGQSRTVASGLGVKYLLGERLRTDQLSFGGSYS